MRRKANGGGGGSARDLAVAGVPLEGGRRVSMKDVSAALLDPSLTTTVTGTFVDVTGAVVTSGQVRFELKPSIATVIQNQNVVEPSVIIGTINSSGQLKAQDGVSACVVVRNTVVEPGGTYYEVSIWPEFIKTAVFSWFATSANQDLSATVPLPPVLPFNPLNVAGVIRVLVITASGTQPPGVAGSAPGPYTYTPSNGTTKLYVECVGGGGGGGGTPATSSNATAAGGGGAGGYSASFLTSLAASYNVTLGAAGNGGAAGANAGAAGGNTAFGSSIVVANGGGGGAAGPTAGTAVTYSERGSGGAAGTGDIAVPGAAGVRGVVLSGTAAAYGCGGNAFFGGGPSGNFWVTSAGGTQGNAAAAAYGCGGSGAVGVTSAGAVAGGNGAAGAVRIWEFA